MALARTEVWRINAAGSLERINRGATSGGGSGGGGGTPQRATKSGTLQVSVFTGGTEVPPIAAPNYTDYPVVDWLTLDTSYPTRNLNLWSQLPNMSTVLRALTSRAYVRLPDGFRGKLVDFTSGSTDHACYAPNCMGLWGNGPGKAVIRLEPYTSTQVGKVPLQSQGGTNPLKLMRLGPANSSTVAGTHWYGLTVMGTDQPNQAADPVQPTAYPAHPHSYQGIHSNYETGATYDWMVIGGVQAYGGAPPEETEAHTFYRSQGQCWMRFCTVTGRQERSIAQGGAPTDYVADLGAMVGGNAASFGGESPTWEDCSFIDSFVSGAPDIAGAGGPSGTMTHNAYFRRCRSNNNANHFVPNPGAKNFSAANMEGAYGTILFDRMNFGTLDNQATLQNPHLFIGNTQTDVPSITIFEPTWDRTPGSFPAATNGAFLVQMPTTYAGAPNKQVTPPTITYKGRVLTAVTRAAGAGWPSGVNPDTQYILIK